MGPDIRKGEKASGRNTTRRGNRGSSDKSK